jgi:hypothetical protein
VTNIGNKNVTYSLRRMKDWRSGSGLEMRTGNTECATQLSVLPVLLGGSRVSVSDDAKLRQHKQRRHQEDAAAGPSAVQSEEHSELAVQSVENARHHLLG